jgi:ADP-ribose pyrophosphatase
LSTSSPDVVDLEIVGEHARTRGPDEGFLHLKRYDLRAHFAGAPPSAAFPCDMVSRARQDAVAVVVWSRQGGVVQVVLRENLRPPVFLRKHKRFVQPDTRQFVLLGEIVAGLLEPGDEGETGIERRAALEVEEEAGFKVGASDVRPLGGPLFASPGISDEKVHFRHVEVDLALRGVPTGDGSVMEQVGRVRILPLTEALALCRTGEMPDMKTEVGLTRLQAEVGG